MQAPNAEITAETWVELVAQATGRPVRVTYTRATRRVLVCETQPDGSYDLRLSRVFATAPTSVQADLCAWMRSGKRARAACARLDRWIDEAVRDLPPSRRTKVRPQGDVHDLEPPCAELLRDEFAGESPLEGRPWPEVTWGRRSGRARYSLRLGSFEPSANLIRVHPVLDQEAVPASFVRYILFHELLHAVVPSTRGRGKAQHHPPEFQRRERAYGGYAEAVAWQDRRLAALLRSARTGRPMARPRSSRAALESAGDKLRQLLLF